MQRSFDKGYAFLLFFLCVLPLLRLVLVVTGTVVIGPWIVLFAFLLCFLAGRATAQSSTYDMIEQTKKAVARERSLIGQLDGRHMAHALLGGRRAYAAGIATVASLVILGLFFWSGLLFWALIIYFTAGMRDAPPLNDVSRLGRGRVVLGMLAFVLLLAILLPVPSGLYGSFGLHSPYM